MLRERCCSTDVDGPFNGVPALIDKLKESQEVRDCVVTQWFRFSYGRSETDEDGARCGACKTSSTHPGSTSRPRSSRSARAMRFSIAPWWCQRGTCHEIFALDRRAALRGAGGIAIGMPWLEIMGCSRDKAAPIGQVAQRATAAVPPKRFIVMYTPNGNVTASFTPAGAGSDFVLVSHPRPARALQIGCARRRWTAAGRLQRWPGRSAPARMAWLTGQNLQPGDQVGNDGVSRAGFANGISIDQHIANAVGASTKFRSLEFGVQLGGADVMHRIAYLGAGQPIPPRKILRVLSVGSSPTSPPTPTRALRSSITGPQSSMRSPPTTAASTRSSAPLTGASSMRTWRRSATWRVASTRPPSSAVPARR